MSQYNLVNFPLKEINWIENGDFYNIFICMYDEPNRFNLKWSHNYQICEVVALKENLL